MNDSSKFQNNEDLAERTKMKEEFLGKLRKDRQWYKTRKTQVLYLWLVLTFTNLFLGFLTSLLIALDWPKTTDQFGKAILVALPAIASFCGTILVQFRLRETWELRELGRIDVDEIIVKTLFFPLDDPDKFTKQLYDLRMASVQLSRLQTGKFFATFSENQAEENRGSAHK